MPEPIEVTRLKQAVEQFEARKPRDLSDGFTAALAALNKELGRGTPEGAESPGQRAANEAGGTGVPLKYAAKGPDQPSPGQREARGISNQIQEAAQRIVAEHQR